MLLVCSRQLYTDWVTSVDRSTHTLAHHHTANLTANHINTCKFSVKKLVGSHWGKYIHWAIKVRIASAKMLLYDKQKFFLLYKYTCNYSSLVGSTHYSSQLDDKKKVVTPWFNRPSLLHRSLASGIVCTGKTKKILILPNQYSTYYNYWHSRSCCRISK